jgi:hypothetical protein
LIIKACLGLTDEELVEQIKGNSYLQFFIGLLIDESSGIQLPHLIDANHKLTCIGFLAPGRPCYDYKIIFSRT